MLHRRDRLLDMTVALESMSLRGQSLRGQRGCVRTGLRLLI